MRFKFKGKTYETPSEWLEAISSSVRMPSADDKLFMRTEDTKMNAYVSQRCTKESTHLYISGYKEAGDQLVQLVEDKEREANDFFYPIVFLYRHYLELHLKDILAELSHLPNLDYKSKPEHRLSTLWSTVKKMLADASSCPNLSDFDPKRDFGQEYLKDLEAMDSLIERFEQVDPRSTAFRYPGDKRGNSSLKLETEWISLSNLKDVIGKMSNLLEELDTYISDYREYLSECYE